jgi:cell shape-determining protein MreD
MPGADIAQYGIATFAIAGVFYIVSLIFKRHDNTTIAEVVQNNTKALEQLVTLIQVSMARQDQKLDELLERARR